MKKLSILLIMVFVLNLFIVGNVFAANLCMIKAYYNPSNPYQGTELTIKMSVSDITKGIKSVNFTVDYDANKFEFSKIEKADGWTAEETQNQITIHTDDNNATTKSGDLGTIILKVKENAIVGNTPVKISNIQVVKEDNSKLNFGELDQNITIQKNNIEKDNNSSDSNKNDDKTDTNKDNTQENSKVDNNTNTDNANKDNTQDANKIDNNVNNNNNNGVSANQKENNNTDNKDTNNIDTTNKEKTAKTNQEDNKSNEQKNNTENKETNSEKTNSKTKTSNKKSNKKDLPYTGYSNIYIAIAVIGVTIYASIAYKKYRNV